MLNIKEFSGLAYYVYRDMSGILKYTPNLVFHRKQYQKLKLLNDMKNHDSIYEVILDNSLQNASNIDNDFYGSIFVKVQNHKSTGIVIAIRGTMLRKLGNDLTDIRSWWKSFFETDAQVNVPTDYVRQATQLCNKAISFAQKDLKLNKSQIYVTGHFIGWCYSSAYSHLRKSTCKCCYI